MRSYPKKQKPGKGYLFNKTTIEDQLGFIVSDLRKVGFDDCVIRRVLEQQYSMLDKLGVKYQRVVENDIIK